MEFSEQDIETYIARYTRLFEETLTPEEAERQMRQVLELYSALAQPLPDGTSKAANG